MPAMPPRSTYVAYSTLPTIAPPINASSRVTISAAPASSSTASSRPDGGGGHDVRQHRSIAGRLSASTVASSRSAISTSALVRCQIWGRKRQTQPSSSTTSEHREQQPAAALGRVRLRIEQAERLQLLARGVVDDLAARHDAPRPCGR